MRELFLSVASRSLSATYLVGVVILLRLLLRKAPKWVSVLLWGVVALRLLCPVTLESAVSLMPDSLSNGDLISSWTDDYVGDTRIIHDNRPEYQEAVSAGRTPLYSEEGSYYVVTAPDGVREPRTVENSVVPLLSVVWLVGMGAMGEYTLFTYLRLKHKVKLAIRITEDVYLSEFVDTPFVLGLLHPRIYLPYHMGEQDSHHVIAHERTHIRRKDHWWKPLGFGLLTVHWFNPVMWVAYILLCRDIEMACDEEAIQGLNAQQRADYSQALLNCSIRPKQIAACPLAFGEVGVKERVKNVLHYRKPALWVVAVCIILVVMVGVGFLTNPVAEKENRTVTLEALHDAQIEGVQLKNMHNGTVSYLIEEEDIESIVHYLSGISGHSGVSAKGYYEGTYSVTLYDASGEETAIGFGDTDSFFYGDFGDGYPVRYQLENRQISEITDFLSRYDISVTGFSASIRLEVERVSPTGATVVFKVQQSTPAAPGRLMGGNDYLLQQNIDGVWKDLPVRENPTFAAEAYEITNIRRHNIDWEWLYGVLPAGEYRICKQVQLQKTDGSADSATVYGVFTIGDSSSSPLYVIQNLSTENLYGSAEFLANGSGYVFFEEMEVRLAEILRALDEDDISPSAGIDNPHTVITLTAGDTTLLLSSDQQQVEISIDQVLSDTRWVITSEPLNQFFAEMNQYSQTYSTYEIYNVAPLNALPAHYSLEEASIDKVVVTKEGLVMHNSEVWAEFWDNSQHGIPATVRCMDASDSGSIIFDIDFDGEEYHYRTMRGEELWDISYRHLLFFQGDAAEDAAYDAFEYFVLVNDDTVTWEDIVNPLSGDQVDHRIVHRHHIYFPKQPQLPEVVQAELVVNGDSIALVADARTVEEIRKLVNGALWLGFEPQTYFFGPRLMLLGKDGAAYSVELDVVDDLCRLGERFYDYGPGMDGETSVNNLPKLLALFGLEDWPDSVKQLHPYLFE